MDKKLLAILHLLVTEAERPERSERIDPAKKDKQPEPSTKKG